MELPILWDMNNTVFVATKDRINQYILSSIEYIVKKWKDKEIKGKQKKT